jgi:hypothetical protein
VLRARGIDLIAADSPTSFLDDTPTARLIRQVLEAVSEFEKAMLVAKLRGARDCKRRGGLKVEGRKSIAEERPATVELARKLARARPKGGKRSLREISAAPRGGGPSDEGRQSVRRNGYQAHAGPEVTMVSTTGTLLVFRANLRPSDARRNATIRNAICNAFCILGEANTSGPSVRC